ncbi:LysR family transcriptional regulator [Candidatus Endobugula sertula]|uniref:LysR family transcriptional regulator n=1 Tax=Candidatus Endobugula sertula TaxID=62101 RepID=A0A1D2QRQ1_9GAMM|nr:LysR family transcriptional regulator [Candidatus Endobugula sertula]
MGRKKASLAGQLDNLDLKLLKIFKTVVESGGFTAAEIELNLANSTISNYISDLEKRLDMNLCKRGRGGFQLTKHGAVVYQATLELLGAINDFQNKVNTSHNRLFGSIHLAITEHTIGKYHSKIINALKQFTQRAPAVKIQISTMESDDVTAAVIDERVDIGITATPSTYPELLKQSLFEEKMTLFCAKPHPLYNKPEEEITASEFASYRFVESPRMLPGREIHPDIKQWNKHAIAHHQEARTALILSGNYLGFLPEHLIEQWGLTEQLKPMYKYSYKNNISAICKKNKINDIVVSTFYSYFH